MPEYKELRARVDPQFFYDLTDMAKKFTMSRSSMIALTSKIGFTYLKIITDPQTLLSPEYLAQVLVEAENKGIEFKMPDDLRSDE